MARAKVTRGAAPVVEYDKQPWNIYSMMLLLALLALIIGCVFLCIELAAYEWDYNAKTATRTAMTAPAELHAAGQFAGRLIG